MREEDKQNKQNEKEKKKKHTQRLTTSYNKHSHAHTQTVNFVKEKYAFRRSTEVRGAFRFGFICL